MDHCDDDTVPWPNLPMHTGENTGCVKPCICRPINTPPFFLRHPVHYPLAKYSNKTQVVRKP